MYSLVKGYIQSRSRSKSEGQQADVEEDEPRKDQKHKRLVRTTSDTSDYVNFLSWESVSFVTSEVQKQVGKGLHWMRFPSVPEDDMAARGKRRKPDGTLEYMVAQSDTLAKIALKFDSTPSELVRLNKLASRMIFAGQTLFVPEKKTLSSQEGSEDLQVITKAPQPSPVRQDSAGHKSVQSDNGYNSSKEHDHETIKLTKDISLDESEEHISDQFLQLKAKYITDGQGVVCGVLLITPHSIIFQPNVSDPLVMDRGQDAYSIHVQMSAITSAAMYHDIAAMAIHDPLKPGRFYLDAETAGSLSCPESSGSDGTPSGSPEHLLSPMPLDVVQEVAADDRGSGNAEDLKIVIKDLLEDIINDIIVDEESCKKTTKHPVFVIDDIRTSSPMHDHASALSDISPLSEDSGITGTLSKKTCKYQDPEKDQQIRDITKMDYRDLSVSGDVTDSNGRTSQLDCDISHDSGITEDGIAADTSSYFTSFSNEVKYWLGLQSQKTEHIQSDSEEELMPRPAAPSEDLPLYLCLRISKKNWCLYREKLKGPGSDLMNRDRKRREYWFAIPHSRVEHVYRFFNNWCPSIHNATDDDDEGSSDDDADTSKESVEIAGETEVETQDEVSKASSSSSTSSLLRGHKVSVAFLDEFAPEMNGKSELLKDIHLKKLNKCLPTRIVGQSWDLVYSTFYHGFSLKTLYHKMNDSYLYQESPVLLVVQDDYHSIFGVLSSTPLRVSESFYGTGESFLFKFEDEDELKIFRWTGENHFYTKGDNDSIAFGGGSGNFGLWLDGDFYHGRSHACSTYNNETLSKQEDFLCSGLEVWAFV